MRIGSALLCDAVTVREGLLHILGGGITRLNRPQFPAPLNASIALQVLVHPTEAASPHQVQVVVQSEDGARLADASVDFELSGLADIVHGEELNVPIVLPLQAVVLPGPGGYSIDVLIDGHHQVGVPFRALLPAEGTGR